MKEKSISKIDFHHIKMMKDTTYNDGDIAFLSDIRKLPMADLPAALEMFVIIVCEHGKLQIEVNDTPYTITEKTMLTYKPQEVINNCMLSHDFKGKILCISHKVLMESFSASDFWDRGFNLMNRRIVPVKDGDIRMYNLYGELFQTKIEQANPVYMKEIIHSLVRAAIYELLSFYKEDTNEYGRGLVKQSEVLFQRFITLLSDLKVKPRNVAWYAEHLCITSKHLASICKQISGKTAFEWINEYVRMDIDNLLRNSNKSIKEIVDVLKFPTMSFFGKYVKAYSGLSPTEYRKKLRESKHL